MNSGSVIYIEGLQVFQEICSLFSTLFLHRLSISGLLGRLFILLTTLLFPNLHFSLHSLHFVSNSFLFGGLVCLTNILSHILIDHSASVQLITWQLFVCVHLPKFVCQIGCGFHSIHLTIEIIELFLTFFFFHASEQVSLGSHSSASLFRSLSCRLLWLWLLSLQGCVGCLGCFTFVLHYLEHSTTICLLFFLLSEAFIIGNLVQLG